MKNEQNNIICPRKNPNFIGHEKTVNILVNSILSQKMPNSWLFSGPKGIGKATLAYRFARTLLATKYSQINKESINELNLSQNDPVFSRIRNNSHSDLLIIENKDSKKDITVDQARQIGKFFRETSSETKYRIVIVDSIDNMNINAANSILKILEEPPENSLLILISHNPGKLLPTIKSRCQELRLKLPDEAKSKQILDLYLNELDFIEKDKIIKLANYSPGLAIYLYQLNALDIYDKLLNIIENIYNLKHNEIHDFANLLNAKDSPENWFIGTHLIDWLISNIIKQLSINVNFGSGFERENNIISMFANKSSLDNLLKIWEKVTILINDTSRVNLDKNSVIVNIFANLNKELA